MRGINMDLHNIFIVGIIFGESQITRLVLAVDKEDAIATVEDYYSHPEIGFVISYEEINQIYQCSKESSNFIFVVEMSREANTNRFIEYKEYGSIEAVQQKYQNRDCLLFNGEFIKQLALETNDLLNNPIRSPLISENIPL